MPGDIYVVAITRNGETLSVCTTGGSRLPRVIFHGRSRLPLAVQLARSLRGADDVYLFV